MSTINLTTNNLKASVVENTDVVTPLQTITTNDDFASKAIAIIRRSAEIRDFDQMDQPLQELISWSSREEVIQSLRNIVQQVKETQRLGDVPEIYRHLVNDLASRSREYLKEVDAYPEEFRIEIAKYFAKKSPLFLCENIHKFQITNREAQVEIAIIANKYDTLDCFSRNMANFSNSEEVRLAIAASVLRDSPQSFCDNIQYYDISSQEILLQLVSTLLQNPGLIKTVCVGIKDENTRILLVNRLLENPKNMELVCENIEHFSVKKEEELIKWAKSIAAQLGTSLLKWMPKFKIKNQKAFMDIVLIVFRHNPIVGPVKRNCLKALLRDFGLDTHMRAILYSRYLQLYPKFNLFEQVFPEGKEVMQSFPELLLFHPVSNFNASKFLFDLWEAEGGKFSSSLMAPLLEEYKRLIKEPDSAAKRGKEQMLVLRCSVFAFAKDSPQLLRQLMAVLDDVEKREECERETILPWIAIIFLSCRLQNLSDVLAKRIPLFKAIVDINDPEFRFSLAIYFDEELSCSRLDTMLGKNQALKEKINKKDLAPFVAGLMTASLWGQIEPYIQLEFSQKMNQESISLKTQSVSFPQRLQALLRNDFFRDALKMNSFFKNLNVLMKASTLTDAEKGHVLRDLLFATDRTLSVKKQSEQIFLSCQLIAQYIELDPQKLVRISDRGQLQAEAQQLVSKLLCITDQQEAGRILRFFEQWRSPYAFLRYAFTLQSLNQVQRNACISLFKLYVESVASGTFSAVRYSIENPCEHMQILHEKAPQLLEAWVKGATFKKDRFKIVDTDDPCDLLLCGSEVGSCQSVDAFADYAKCLIAYLLDPKVRLMAVKNEKGTIVARSILRLLWDKKEKQFVLFQEMLYPDECPKKFAEMINAACIERAKQLHIPLLKREGDSDDDDKGIVLTAFKGRAPFEYVDALDEDHIQTNDTGYEIPGCNYIYVP